MEDKVPIQTPTQEIYEMLDKALDHFNQTLFDGQLPTLIITLQRQKNVMGYFSKNRWVNKEGSTAHELALNPSYFATYPLIELFQTIVHEQCHLWQSMYGSPGRGKYHNHEWADKMEEVGLIPSHTGKPGGKRTGDKMSDYPAPNGQFLQACRQFLKGGEELKWIDRFPTQKSIKHFDLTQEFEGLEHVEVDDVLQTVVSHIMPGVVEPTNNPQEKIIKAKTKVKYTCPSCLTNVWGKPNIKLGCLDCNEIYAVN